MIPARRAGTLASMDRPRHKPRRPIRRLLLLWLLVCAIGILASCVRIAVSEAGQSRVFAGGGGIDRRASAGLAPAPSAHDEAIIQVYAARTWGAKKVISVHTWFAVKGRGAPQFTTYQVIGWRLRRRGSALVVEQGVPDRPWYGNTPELLLDLRGDRAEALIERLERAVAEYPFADRYRAWPGPNSNTFTAFVGRRLPELGLDLPATAIGKDYLGERWWDATTAGDGWQGSLAGLAGLAIGPSTGLEVNLLGLNVEIDPADGAIDLPGWGRLGGF